MKLHSKVGVTCEYNCFAQNRLPLNFIYCKRGFPKKPPNPKTEADRKEASFSFRDIFCYC